MNIYKYIESKTISSYLEDNNIELSIMDCANMICTNLNISIEEKIKAYRDLIDTMQDLEIRQSDHECKTAKELLCKYINDQRALLNEIDSKKYDCHITFHYQHHEGKAYTTTYKSNDYQQVIKDEISQGYDGLQYIVLYIEQLKLKGLIDSLGRLVDLDHESINKFNCTIEKHPTSFDMPFAKGDILYVTKMKNCQEPFVLESINSTKKGIQLKGYSINKDLYTEDYSTEDIFHLDYYSDDESVAEYQYLKALSLYVQDKISEPELSKIRDFARIKIKQDEMIGELDFNDNTREILYNLMG